ncbi:hypothetical protein ACGFX4_32695 [Kitasatospora sp. NPDC048365]|uniref:hypothetical protein n=1 Tax=Kitasatospora sp. NPDC048365 TaxID=3364050 RepID=UPI003712EB59
MPRTPARAAAGVAGALAALLLLATGCGTAAPASPPVAPTPSFAAPAASGTAAGGTGAAGGPSPTGATAAPAPSATDVELRVRVSGGQVSGPAGRPVVPLGRAVVLTVEADVSDEVHVHGYDLHGDAAPGRPVTIRFTADIPGQFEVELEDAHLRLLRFEVR